jgi:hypothetical protein
MVQCGWCTQRWCNADDAYSDGAVLMMHTVVIVMMMQMMIHAVRKVTMHIAYLSVAIRYRSVVRGPCRTRGRHDNGLVEYRIVN